MPHAANTRLQRAFTLVEILIVVVILGILAALVVPRFSSAVEESQLETTRHELGKLQRAVEVYQARNGGDAPPNNAATWDLLTSSGEYLKQRPRNALISDAVAGTVIVDGNGPAAGWRSDAGWIYDEATGSVWAVGLDADGNLIPR